jgi:tetratricopeptide (TPR) repeat protein
VRSLLAAGRKDEAISTLKQQLDNKQNQLFAKFLLGDIYGQQGDQARAQAYLEDVVKEKPGDVAAWASMAGLYKEREKRIAVYQRAVKAAPGNPELNVLLASEYEQAGRFDDAIGLYEGLLKSSPAYEPAINNLAALLLDHRTDKASHARALELSKSLPNVDENPFALDTLGWAHYRVGQYTEAVRVLERVVAYAGQIPVFRYHLGMAYLGAGNPVGAMQELREAVEKAQGDYPGLAEAQATLEKLKKAS